MTRGPRSRYSSHARLRSCPGSRRRARSRRPELRSSCWGSGQAVIGVGARAAGHALCGIQTAHRAGIVRAAGAAEIARIADLPGRLPRKSASKRRGRPRPIKVIVRFDGTDQRRAARLMHIVAVEWPRGNARVPSGSARGTRPPAAPRRGRTRSRASACRSPAPWLCSLQVPRQCTIAVSCVPRGHDLAIVQAPRVSDPDPTTPGDGPARSGRSLPRLAGWRGCPRFWWGAPFDSRTRMPWA